MIEIKVKNGNVERAIRELKKKTKENNLLGEVRERQEYKKPSAIKRQRNLKWRLRNKYRIIQEKQLY